VILGTGGLLALAGTLGLALVGRRREGGHARMAHIDRNAWRMPKLEDLSPLKMTPMRRLWMIVLRGYLVIAVIMVIVRVVQLAYA